MAAPASAVQQSENLTLDSTTSPPTPFDEKKTENGYTTQEKALSPAESPAPKSLKFWSVFLALCLLGLSTALEATIVTTALPTIIKSIDMGNKYVWVGNAFLLASAAIQPFVGQLADVFGRRWPLLLLTACFVLGSGIAGGAKGAGMLIGGRTVQGLGAGGILVLIDVVVSDLVPLQERAKFMGLVRITGALGSSIGPIVGGAIAKADWRWCFYLNLVTGGLALVYLALFLDLKHEPKPWKDALARIDFVGAAIFTCSVTSVLLGLVMGGVVFPWGSANIIVPLVLGFLGWAVFHWYESTKFCNHPMVPSRLFGKRTSSAGFFMAFDGALLLYWVIWFLPVYFQGVLGASPLGSGVDQLPLNMFLVPSGIVAGGSISKTGKYKPQHFVGFTLISVGVGLFTLLHTGSHKAAWVCFQIIAAIGLGIILVAVLPAIQSALSDKDVATTTATYAFVRSFGGIWGVTIPSIIFNGRVNKLIHRIEDAAVRQRLANGNAYGFASTGSVQSLGYPTREEVLGVYSDALKTVWQVGIAFALAGFLAIFAVKQYDMSRKNESKFGLDEEKEESAIAAEKGDIAASTPSTFLPKQCVPRTSHLLGSMIGESTITVARKYLRDHLPPIAPGAVVHDNGCGTGAVTRAVLETYPELVSSSPATTIYATDINASFVEDFKRVVESRGWEAIVRSEVMAAEELALPDSSVTHSFTNFLIFGARDAPKAAAEAMRTLAPGGVAVMTTWATLPHAKALDRTRKRLYGEHGSHIKPEWFESSHLEKLLRDAGFPEITAVAVESGMVHDSMDAWTQMAWSWMGMPHGGWAEKDESEWDMNRGMYGEECLKEGFKVDEDGRVRVNMVANVVIARKAA
jgi:MFS family permease/ubiquinone/menaquinone biosynthesis C-methylase UbiE